MNWLRLHHDARNDAKLRTLTDSQFRVWFNLLLYASEQDERGTINTDSLDLLAIEVAKCDTALLEETLGILVKLKIISWDIEEGNHIQFVHFLERQYDKPSDAPDAVRARVQKFRENLKRDVTPRNAHTQNQIQTRPEAYTDQPTNPPSPLLPDVVPAAGQTARPVGGGGGDFEKMVSVLVSESWTVDEIQWAKADIQAHPPIGVVRSPLALYRKVLARRREEATADSTAPVPKPEPVETPEQRAKREAHEAWRKEQGRKGAELGRRFEAERNAKNGAVTTTETVGEAQPNPP